MSKSVTISPHSFRHSTGSGQTDGRTELVKEYRAQHALHADARKKIMDERNCCRSLLRQPSL